MIDSKNHYYLHSSLHKDLLRLKTAGESFGSGANPIFISTYQPHERFSYLEVIGVIRRRAIPNLIVLLSFETIESIWDKDFSKANLGFLRLPFSDEELRLTLHGLSVATSEEIQLIATEARRKYIVDTLKQLKHGKQLEMLNSSLIPLRAVCVNVLSGLSSYSSIQKINMDAIRPYLELEEVRELIYCLERNRAEDPEYEILYGIFTDIGVLSNNIIDSVVPAQKIIDKIEGLVNKFDKLKLTQA